MSVRRPILLAIAALLSAGEGDDPCIAAGPSAVDVVERVGEVGDWSRGRVSPPAESVVDSLGDDVFTRLCLTAGTLAKLGLQSTSERETLR